MLGLGWLSLRQAQEALRTGRLEEAERLLGQPSVQGHKRAGELQQQLTHALLERAERQLRGDDAAGAWTDLLRAEQVGVSEAGLVKLRQALTRLGLAEVRALLEASEAARAVEAAAQLRQRGVRQPELDPLEEAARQWVLAHDLADRGDFAQAGQAVERVGRLLMPAPAAVSRFREEVAERGQAFSRLLVALHEAASEERWQDVLRLAEQVLAIAPQQAEARKVRGRAWKAIEPATVLTGPAPAAGEPAAPAPPAAKRFLLWIDGVGGYLVCLGNRITIGQATPEASVDVPLFADVSRLHAALTRDAEGYLLEALRPVVINGRPTEKALLNCGDRLTLGASCQLQFRQPVPVSASARLDLASGHGLRLSVDAVLLMADTLVLGPGRQVHVQVPDLREPVILYRHRDGLGLRHGGTFTVNGQPCTDRALLEPGATVRGEDFALALEPVGSRQWALSEPRA
jgi:tetratricopeptide (TPR) repeat protein